jgi:hypothetical protein
MNDLAATHCASTAMAAAQFRIGVAFDAAAGIAVFKRRVERILRQGPTEPVIRARFGRRAALLAGYSLDTAIARVEQWWRDERKAFQIASTLGCGTRLSLEILRELRLILRFMRRNGMNAEFYESIAVLCDRATAIAAE